MKCLFQSSKKGRLALLYFCVLLSLIFNIVSYDVCRCVPTDGVNIVTFRQELSTPQHPLDLWILFEYCPCRDALDCLNDLFGRCCGDGLYEQVHMVAVCADFDEVDVIS